MKRLVLLVMLAIGISCPVFSSPETWLGLSFIAGRNYINGDVGKYYTVYDLDGNVLINGMDIGLVRRVGGKIDVTIFPLSSVRVGIVVSGSLMFPVGFDWRSGGSEGYFSRNLDLVFDGEIGVSYYQLFGSAGFFIDGGMFYSYNRVAKENEKNYREETTYDIFHEWGVWGELGLLATFHNGFFRLGFKYNHDLCYSDMNFNISLFAGGGVIFR